MNNSRNHILVVDDDPEIRLLLKSYLEKNGYQVSTAVEGSGMWSVLGQTRIDLIVLDLMLPGEDGLSIARRLRSEHNLPIIMVSARGEDIELPSFGTVRFSDDTHPFIPHASLLPPAEGDSR